MPVSGFFTLNWGQKDKKSKSPQVSLMEMNTDFPGDLIKK